MAISGSTAPVPRWYRLDSRRGFLVSGSAAVGAVVPLVCGSTAGQAAVPLATVVVPLILLYLSGSFSARVFLSHWGVLTMLSGSTAPPAVVPLVER